MSEADLEKLRCRRQQIQRLAEDDGATDAERENALRRIAEIDERIELARTQVRRFETVEWPELFGGSSSASKSVSWPTDMGHLGDEVMRRGMASMKKKVLPRYFQKCGSFDSMLRRHDSTPSWAVPSSASGTGCQPSRSR